MATLGSLIYKIQREMGDPDGTNYVDDEVRDNINDVVKSITRTIAAKRPEFWLLSGEAYADEITLASGTQSYDVDDSLYQVIDVDYPDSDEPYPALDLRAAMAGEEGYLLRRTDTGKEIVFYPEPGDELDGETATVYCVLMPSNTEDLSTDVPLSDLFEDLIVQQVTVRLKIRGGEQAEGVMYMARAVQQQLDMLYAQSNAADRRVEVGQTERMI